MIRSTCTGLRIWTKEKIIKSRENELNSLENRLTKIITSNNNIVNQSEYSKNLFLKRKKELEDKIHSIKYVLKIFREIDVEKNSTIQNLHNYNRPLLRPVGITK